MNRAATIHSFLLERMSELISSRGWCQHVMAQDRDGVPCYIEDKVAWNFSLIGALFQVLGKYPLASKQKEKTIRAILQALNERNAKEGLVKSPRDLAQGFEAQTDEWKNRFNRYNDAPGRTKMEILRLLKEAMEG